MTHKTAYIWGPVSSFSGPLVAFLVQKGWHVHVATKGAFHFALSPLDLRSTAQESIERAFGDPQRYYVFEDRIKYLDVNESPRGTKYDAVIFCGLPPNFDEARVSRAPWAAENYSQIVKRFKGSPVFIVSSLWGAVQNDGVVPEEIECERRKTLTRFEAVAQAYENKLLRTLGSDEADWFLVRLPMMSGSSVDGRTIDFSGPMGLFEQLVSHNPGHLHHEKTLSLQYNPDATLWFLPVDVAVHIFWRLLEDEQRPRITNLVSTQATLNQEWLTHLAKALGYSKAAHVENDSYNLPTVLRKTLQDNVLVKTRGLFEVMGRYQQLPVHLDNDYFTRVLNFAREKNWGKLVVTRAAEANGKRASSEQTIVADAQVVSEEVSTAEELARAYFTEFLPQNADSAAVREVMTDGSGIGFRIDQQEHLDWTLRAENGHAVVEPTQNLKTSPKVRFYFTPEGLKRLLNRKVSLEVALVTREASVKGPGPREVLRAMNFLKRFMKEHPYDLHEPRKSKKTKNSQ